MADRIKRSGSFRRKSGLTLSKGETALEHSFKEADVEKPADIAAVELDRVPDVIYVASLSQDQAIDIVAKTDTVNKKVRVSNKDADNAVDVSVNGGTAVTIAANSSADIMIEDSTKTDAPLEL